MNLLTLSISFYNYFSSFNYLSLSRLFIIGTQTVTSSCNVPGQLSIYILYSPKEYIPISTDLRTRYILLIRKFSTDSLLVRR